MTRLPYTFSAAVGKRGRLRGFGGIQMPKGPIIDTVSGLLCPKWPADLVVVARRWSRWWSKGGRGGGQDGRGQGGARIVVCRPRCPP